MSSLQDQVKLQKQQKKRSIKKNNNLRTSKNKSHCNKKSFLSKCVARENKQKKKKEKERKAELEAEQQEASKIADLNNFERQEKEWQIFMGEISNMKHATED